MSITQSLNKIKSVRLRHTILRIFPSITEQTNWTITTKKAVIIHPKETIKLFFPINAIKRRVAYTGTNELFISSGFMLGRNLL